MISRSHEITPRGREITHMPVDHTSAVKSNPGRAITAPCEITHPCEIIDVQLDTCDFTGCVKWHRGVCLPVFTGGCDSLHMPGVQSQGV